MHDAERWHPAAGEAVIEPFPVAVAFVTAPSQALPPHAQDGSGERYHRRPVPRDRVVVVVPLHHTPQPCSRFRNRSMHPHAEFVFDIR